MLQDREGELMKPRECTTESEVVSARHHGDWSYYWVWSG